MLWVYGRYNFFKNFSVVAVFRRQNLASMDGPRVERVNTSNMFDLDFDLVDKSI